MKKIYGIAFATALMALASCSSDAPEINNPDVIDGPIAGYVKMNLPAGTRTADGSTKVIFYKDGNVVAHTITSEANVFAVSVVPDNVVVFQDDNSLKDEQDNTITTTNVDAKTPAVFGDNTYGSKVGIDNIFHNLDDASSATPVTVYLDCTIASVKVAADKASIAVPNKLIGYTITFDPEFVFVNGVAQKTPVIKTVPQAATPGGATADQLGYADANGKGSHWTSTYYNWNSDDVLHYALKGDKTKATAGKTQTVNIFERAMQTASDVKKNHTHVIVAGQYKLTAAEGYYLPSDENIENKWSGHIDNWDGTFYVYGADAEGNGRVYFKEADVVKAMGATGSLTAEVTTPNGMHTHMKAANGETCLKYDKGYVYYAEPIVTKIGEVTYGKGVVRNHKYEVNVTEIKGWGIAIPDTNDPIIPENGPRDNEESFVKLNIVVNPMVTVAGQEIKW